MWSKAGSSRNSARGNTFSPQPVSGVESPSSRERTALATREERRLIQLSRRCVRQPDTSAGTGMWAEDAPDVVEGAAPAAFSAGR